MLREYERVEGWEGAETDYGWMSQQTLCKNQVSSVRVRGICVDLTWNGSSNHSIIMSIWVYSGTFGYLPTVATLLTWPLDVVRIEAPLIQYLGKLPNVDTSLFHKADRFDYVDARMTLMQDCPPPLVDSTTEYCNSPVMHSTSLGLVFLTSVQQGRALESVFVALNSTTTYTYQKYTRSLHL